MSFVFAVLFIVGLVVASLASRRAVVAAIRASEALAVHAGLVGVTVLAIGTDLPEIATAIIAAIGDHGDLIVGDAAGSALTQVTFVLAVLCFVSELRAERRSIAVLGALTVAALLLVAVFVRDGEFARLEGLVLVCSWVAALGMAWATSPPAEETLGPRGPWVPHVAGTLGWLAVVAVAATVVVQSFIQLTETLGVPELVASAVVLALGTSLPELVVDLAALRRGAVALALGDLFGSSLLDATLAIGIGPTLRTTTVSSEAALTCVFAAAGVAAATVIIARRERHHISSAVWLLIAYVGAMIAIVLTGAHA